jgi:hypothetical protein
LKKGIHPLPLFLFSKEKSDFLRYNSRFSPIKIEIKNLHRTTPNMRLKSFAHWKLKNNEGKTFSAQIQSRYASIELRMLGYVS